MSTTRTQEIVVAESKTKPAVSTATTEIDKIQKKQQRRKEINKLSRALLKTISDLDFAYLLKGNEKDLNYRKLIDLLSKGANTSYIIDEITKDKHSPLKEKILKLGQSSFRHFGYLLFDLIFRAILNNNLLFLKHFLSNDNVLENLIIHDILKLISPDAIFIAILASNVHAAEFLIEHGIKLDEYYKLDDFIKDHFGDGLKQFEGLTPLHAAIQMGHEPMVSLISTKMREQELPLDMKERGKISLIWSYTPADFALKLGKPALSTLIIKEQNKAIIQRPLKMIEHYNAWKEKINGQYEYIDKLFLDEFVETFSKNLASAENIIEAGGLSSEGIAYINCKTQYLADCLSFFSYRNNYYSSKALDINYLIQFIKSYESVSSNFINSPLNILIKYFIKELESLLDQQKYLKEEETILEETWDVIISRAEIFDRGSFILTWNTKLLFPYGGLTFETIKNAQFSALKVIKDSSIHGVNIKGILAPSIALIKMESQSRNTNLSRIDDSKGYASKINDDSGHSEYLEASMVEDYFEKMPPPNLELASEPLELRDDEISEPKIIASEFKSESKEMKNEHETEIPAESSSASSSITTITHRKDTMCSNYDKLEVFSTYETKSSGAKQFSKSAFPECRTHILQTLRNGESHMFMDSKDQYPNLLLSEIDVLICQALNHKNDNLLLFLVQFLPKQILFDDRYQKRWETFMSSYDPENDKVKMISTAGLFSKIQPRPIPKLAPLEISESSIVKPRFS